MTDLEKIKQMEELNWKPASQYWCEQYHMKRKKLVEAADEIVTLRQQVQHVNDHADAAIEDMERMREGLIRIANYPIPRPYFGKGGATIPEAMRNIARAALEECK